MEDTGISAWAAYQYGRMSAETAAHNDRCIRGFRARLRGETVFNAVTVADENVQLRQLLAEQDIYAQRLISHFQEVEAERARLSALGSAMEAHVATLEQRVANLQQLVSTASGEIALLQTQYDIDTVGLRLENEELKRLLKQAEGASKSAG